MLRAVLAIVGTVAGLIFLLSFKTHGTTATATPPAAISGTSGSTSGTASTPAASTPAASSSPSRSRGTAAAKSFTGDAADTRYGPVQVKITVKNGKLTAVDAIEYPQQDPRDAQINSYAIPALNTEAVAAGSARIDVVTGATYTSEGYMTSLQSALDQAGI
jgi:uncharacterized protein with FMN-binding domain